jgi:hypothetical protein
MGRIFQNILVIWAILALLGWGIIFLAQRAVSFPQVGYYVVLLFGVGIPLWVNRARLKRALQRWPLPPLLRFLVLGYGMVLLEEIIAASFNHLIEGFDLATYPLRIGQFWALNIFAFTGFIWGWYFLRRWVVYSPREAFFLSGIFGLFAEHTLAYIVTNSIAFFLLAPLNIFTYGIILTPAMLSVPASARKPVFFGFRYILAFLAPLVASLPAVLALTVLRSHFPGWFPPCRFAAC